MRRFSQRSALVTLSEINITPLLDLAFVLLIIFVITTPLLEKGLDVNLPEAQNANSLPKPEDLRAVDVTTRGDYALKGRVMTLDNILAQLQADYVYNKNLVIEIRADGSSLTKHVVALIDGCRKRGLCNFAIGTQAGRTR